MIIQEKVVSLDFIKKKKTANSFSLSALERQIARQLDEYFSGQRSDFSLPIKLFGTPFQIQVWQALQNIPFGQTISYQEVARQINYPTAVRAVANATGCNPLPIIIPCHRVIRSAGQLGGYHGGLLIKKYLLDLEKSKKMFFQISKKL